MATDTATPLLNLDTLANPATVVIDKQPYVILAPDALNVLDFRRLQALIPRLERLDAQEMLTDEEGEEFRRHIDAICRLVLQAPEDVHARLSDVQRIAVYMAFAELPSSMLQLMGAKLKAAGATMPPPLTGASSPRNSPAATAAPRSTGSRTSRSRSSGPASK